MKQINFSPLIFFVLFSFITAMTISTLIPRNIVIIGGGIQGTCVAYHLRKHPKLHPSSTIAILEAKGIASAASGKGGGFMARSVSSRRIFSHTVNYLDIQS
jgi:glycine/D-amino acid oxidase-like deaminating enzyme